MALKLVRKKKVRPVASGRQKKSEIEKFKDAVEVQLRLASGEKVKKGRVIAKSWMVDGKEYGVEKVLVPRAGNRPLYRPLRWLHRTRDATDRPAPRARVVPGPMG